jgi:ketosteroid isomerase-like protein
MSSASPPTIPERDQLFKTFGRAWFRRDVALLYEAVTPDFTWAYSDGAGNKHTIASREAVAAEFAAMGARKTRTQFADVVYHHAPDATFMTFRVIESDPETGVRVREDIGVERYTFRDGRIALKDVYRKSAT